MNALEKYAAKQKLTDRLREKSSPAIGAALGTALGYPLALPGIMGGAALGAHMGKKKGVQYQGSPSARAAAGAAAASTLGSIPYTALVIRDLIKAPNAEEGLARMMGPPKGALRKALFILPLATGAAGAALAARSAKPKQKTAQLAAVGKAIGALQTPKFLGKILGGQPLSKAYSRGLYAMHRYPGKTARLAGLGGLAFMAGRSSKN